MDLLINQWIDPEIRDLKDQQQRCLSCIDDLENKHQSDTSTSSNPQRDNWNQMRNTIKEETRKEIEFLEAKLQEGTEIENEFEVLSRAKDSGTLPADHWRETLKDLDKRGLDLEVELRRRKQLKLEISENGRMDVKCTREKLDKYRPLLFFAYFSIQADLRRTELDKYMCKILDKQTEFLKLLNFEKASELNQSENNCNLIKRHVENKFYSQISFVNEQVSCELELLQSHRLKLQDLEKRTDIFKKRLEMLYANGQGLMDPSFEAFLEKQEDSLKKEWDTLLAFQVPDVFDLKFGIIRGVLKVTCTSSSGTAVCPGNTKKGKAKRQKTTNNGVVSV